MTEAPATTPTFEGSYSTQQKHDLGAGILDAAIANWESAATKFGADAIKDANTRQRYAAHVKKISDEVRSEVANGTMTVQEGAEYCNRMRDQLFVEYRKYTSSVGVANAERLKLESRGFDYYLNKYAQKQFGKQFSDLSETERNKVYYSVIESAGRPNATVNAKVRKLQVRGKVFLIITALLAADSIINSQDKVKEAARQGSIIAGGMLGGGLAGFGVSFVCGPAEPVCAVALVYIGSSLGGMAGEALNDVYQDELDEFNGWMAR
ncbi:hypothetical protein [Paraburkholderia tropica]|uniref:hypothetical protein n=1 Tax=Paraburkholderia tropica TaxID=92647 RepID=UPI002AB1E2EA|nr:hypothetical protein [Paraburkholderia tropica]